MSKFDKIFTLRPVKPTSELPPAKSPAIKAAMKAERFNEDRPAPRRRFEGLTTTEGEACSDADRLMWVVVDGPVRSWKLWAATDKATWIAANHNDPAPPDEQLIAAGWRPGDLWPVHESGATE